MLTMTGWGESNLRFAMTAGSQNALSLQEHSSGVFRTQGRAIVHRLAIFLYVLAGYWLNLGPEFVVLAQKGLICDSLSYKAENSSQLPFAKWGGIHRTCGV